MSPEEYVASSFSLVVERISADVVSEMEDSPTISHLFNGSTTTSTTTEGSHRIARALILHINAQFEKRKQGFCADLRVGKVGIMGADETQKVLFMDDTKSGALQPRPLTRAGTLQPQKLTRELTYVHVDQHTGRANIMALMVDSEPLSGDADMAITLDVRPCYLNFRYAGKVKSLLLLRKVSFDTGVDLSHKFVTVLGEWVREVQNNLTHVSVLAERAREGFARVATNCLHVGEDFGVNTHFRTRTQRACITYMHVFIHM